MLAHHAPRSPAPFLACRGIRLRLHVRPNAFGNALGNSIARRIADASQQEMKATQPAGNGLTLGGSGGSGLKLSASAVNAFMSRPDVQLGGGVSNYPQPGSSDFMGPPAPVSSSGGIEAGATASGKTSTAWADDAYYAASSPNDQVAMLNRQAKAKATTSSLAAMAASMSTNTFDDGVSSIKLAEQRRLDAQGITTRDGVYRPGLDDPVRERVFNLAGHQGITHRIAWFAGLRQGSQEYQQFMDGAIVLDFPASTDPLSSERASGSVLKNWVLGLRQPGTVMYESHYGSLQTWHAMSPDSRLTNGEVLDKIVGHAREWYVAAQTSGSYVPLGKLAGHLIPDAYAPGHPARNQSGEVLFFQGYGAQNPSAHSESDGPLLFADGKHSYKTQSDSFYASRNVQDAIAAGRYIMNLYTQGADFSQVELFLRESVFRFAPGAKEKPSGGSLPEYAKPVKSK